MSNVQRKRSASPETEGPQGNRQRSRPAPSVSSVPASDSPLSFSSPLVSLDRHTLSLVLQCLPYDEKLREVSRICRGFPALEPGDFCCDEVSFPVSFDNEDWQQEVRRLQSFCSSARAVLLLSHAHGFAVDVGSADTVLVDHLMTMLCPPAPTTPSSFSRLRSLTLRHLNLRNDAALLHRLFPSTAAFPCLEKLDMGGGQSSLDSAALLPLTRIPCLRSLTLGMGLAVGGFFALCALPLRQLDLSECELDYDADDAIDVETPSTPLAVTTAWRVVALPGCMASDDGAGAVYATVCTAVLQSYADSCATEAAADATFRPMLERLRQGWDIDVRCTQTLARLPSLTSLVEGGISRDDFAPDPSPLVRHDMRPMLPRLHTFHFPPLGALSPEQVASVVDSSAAFLTAYSQQLRDLLIRVYSVNSATRLLECALRCSQLESVEVFCDDARLESPRGAAADVEQLDPAVAQLPPLRLLKQLSIGELYLTERALEQLLGQCPALAEDQLEELRSWIRPSAA